LNYGRAYEEFVRQQNLSLIGTTPMQLNPAQADRAQNVVININNGNITAQEIADKINRGNRSTGTNLIRAN